MTSARDIASEMWQILLPTACAGCDEPGVTLCPTCADGFAGPPRERRVAGLRVVSAASWDETTSRVMRTFKREGRPGLAGPLGRALARAVDAVAENEPRPALVPVPSTRAAYRRRGFRPVEAVMRGGRLPVVPVLAASRGVADQRLLGRAARERNMAEAFTLVRALPAGARGVILIDDVVTTGATLHAAQRALASRGVRVIGAATVLATPRRISQENDR